MKMLDIKSKVISIYSDGGYCFPIKRGAYAYVILENERDLVYDNIEEAKKLAKEIKSVSYENGEFNGVDNKITNNTMELCGAINGLIKAKELYKDEENVRFLVYSDSAYVISGMTKWMNSWKKNNWYKIKTGIPVQNKDYWIVLDELRQDINVEWNWCRAHSGIVFNEVCDSEIKKLYK